MKLNIEIDLNTDSREQIAIIANMLNNVTNASRRPSASAQPEVASNTGSEGSGFPLSPSDPAVTGEAIPAAEAAPEASPVPVKEAVKRTRRTKAEMEADAAKEAAPAVEKPADAPSTEPTQDTPSTSVETVAAASTLDDVRTALQAFTATQGVPAGIELLKEFGAARISELKAENYSAFIVKCGNV